MKRITGFTLIEVLVTITVIGVLISAAVPSFKTTIQNGRMVSQANDLLVALVFARSQAIAGTADVIICASTDVDTATTPTCSSSATAWKSGWIVGTGSTSSITALRVHGALTGNNTLTNTSGVADLTFGKGTGIPTAGLAYPLYFDLCDSRGASYGRAIYLSATGEGRVSPTPGKKIDGATALTC